MSIDLTTASIASLREISSLASRLISERECMSGLGMGLFKCSLERGHDGPHECIGAGSDHDSMLVRLGYRVTWEQVTDANGAPIK